MFNDDVLAWMEEFEERGGVAAEIEALRYERHELQERISERDHEIVALEATLWDREQKIEARERKIAELENVLRNADSGVKVLQRRIRELESEVGALTLVGEDRDEPVEVHDLCGDLNENLKQRECESFGRCADMPRRHPPA